MAHATMLKTLKNEWGYYLFLAPGLLMLALFFYYPSLSAVYYSLFEWDGFFQLYVGLDNFRDMLKDPMLHDSVRNLVVLTIGGLVISTVVPLGVAEMIFNLKSQGLKKFFKISFLVTSLVPAIVVMLIWQFIFDPCLGPLNTLLEHLGFGPMSVLWLGDPRLALYCLLLIGFPWISGTSVLIFLAGLNNIPDSVLEYCQMEGIKPLKRVLYIDLFFILGQLRLLLITGLIGLLQAFSLQLVLTQGRPGTKTLVPGFYMYVNAFSYDRMGYASAIGVVMALVIFAFTLLNLKFLKSDH